jgi:hypothetical protein
MNKETIQEKIDQALRRLAENDSALLNSDVNERSMTHQLAIYLADEFTDYDYDVDCEYNRMFYEGVQVQKKSIRVEEMPTVSIGDLSARTAYPDIIVHWREDDKHNLLIIEAKKTGLNPSEDYKKLNGFMEDKNDHGLGYEFSAFVIFDTGNPANSSAKVKQKGDKW